VIGKACGVRGGLHVWRGRLVASARLGALTVVAQRALAVGAR
jgi:hypothetical protein